MYEPSSHLASFYISGMQYWDGTMAVGSLKPGDALKLVAEFDNPHDPQAIAIYSESVKMGFVPRDENQILSQLLYFGHGEALTCRVLQVNIEAHPARQVLAGVYFTDARK